MSTNCSQFLVLFLCLSLFISDLSAAETVEKYYILTVNKDGGSVDNYGRMTPYISKSGDRDSDWGWIIIPGSKRGRPFKFNDPLDKEEIISEIVYPTRGEIESIISGAIGTNKRSFFHGSSLRQKKV